MLDPNVPTAVITLRGLEGAVLFVYHTAAHLAAWRITGSRVRWTLTATIKKADRFQLKQRPLQFTAPRIGGYWCWPLESVTVGEHELRATLGPPTA